MGSKQHALPSGYTQKTWHAEEAVALLGDSVRHSFRAPVLESEGQELASLLCPFPNSVTQGKLINHSELQFPHV